MTAAGLAKGEQEAMGVFRTGKERSAGKKGPPGNVPGGQAQEKPSAVETQLDFAAAAVVESAPAVSNQKSRKEP